MNQIECVGGPLDGETIVLYRRRVLAPYVHHEGWTYTYRKGKYVSGGHKKTLTIYRLVKMLFVVIWFKIWPVRIPKTITCTLIIEHEGPS